MANKNGDMETLTKDDLLFSIVAVLPVSKERRDKQPCSGKEQPE